MSWEIVLIKDITKNLDNKRKPLNESERSKISLKKLYPYVGANNIMGYVDEYLFDEEIVCIAEDGGSWGEGEKCCVHIAEKCWVNNHAHVLTFNGKADLKFLMYYFNSTNLNKYITGSTRGKLTKTALDSIQIPLPPLPIQKPIAEILDAADALKCKDQKLLKKYDELAQAIFIDMFGDPVRNEKGWEVTTVGEVCHYIKDGPHVSPQYTQEGVPFISVNNIIKGTIDLSNCKYISQEDFEMYSKKGKPEFGDILYTKGGTTGFAKRVDLKVDFIQWVHVALLKYDKETINAFFFEYMLNSSYCYHQSQLLTKGIANRDLVLGEIKKIKIFLPPIDLQKEFEKRASIVEKLKYDQVESKNESGNLFNSLIQKAFNGELVS
jgi:type I restriction enzyme S subunit